MDEEQFAPERVQDEAAIRSIEAAYDSAWDAADVDGLLALFTSNAVVIDPFGGMTSGVDAIRAFYAALFRGRARGSTHSSVIIGVHFFTENAALADGEATIEGLRYADDGPPQTVVHRFTDVLVKHAEFWRIAQVRAYVLLENPRPGDLTGGHGAGAVSSQMIMSPGRDC